MKYLCLIAFAALTACGGGSGNPPVATPPAVTPPVTMADTFYAAVMSLIGDSSDTREPVAVDAISLTTPDNTEPEAVK